MFFLLLIALKHEFLVPRVSGRKDKVRAFDTMVCKGLEALFQRVRAESHVRQFRHIMQSQEPGGRKLNFLLQELHREFNTIGSKIGHAGTSHRVVDIKAELEKIREQIQNVE